MFRCFKRSQRHIVTNYIAARAFYSPEIKMWELTERKSFIMIRRISFDEQIYPSLKIEHWSETPFRLGSANEVQNS